MLCVAPRCPGDALSRCSASFGEIWCAAYVRFADLLWPERRLSHFAAHFGRPSGIDVRYCYDGAALPCFLRGVLLMLSFQAPASRFDIIVVAADSQARPTIWSQ